MSSKFMFMLGTFLVVGFNDALTESFDIKKLHDSMLIEEKCGQMTQITLVKLIENF